MAEKKIGQITVDADQPEYVSDTTGGDAIEGTVHVMQEQMRAAGNGVFEAKSNGSAPSNKALSGAGENKSLSGMTKAQLLNVAKAEGVAVETDDNKADLVAKIEKARS